MPELWIKPCEKQGPGEVHSRKSTDDIYTYTAADVRLNERSLKSWNKRSCCMYSQTCGYVVKFQPFSNATYDNIISEQTPGVKAIITT